ncbi:MAG: glycogen/starch/alpha-glucan phosphorylase [Candidatus Brocadiaceae bacterium]|nr:glycogen/starch/alpha-glucan phosphorylase [Candidatus Brocadiaceae bacterium]
MKKAQKTILRDKTLKHSQPVPKLTKLPPLGMKAKDIRDDYRRYFNHTLGRDKYCRSLHYSYNALALAIRDRLSERWKQTRYTYRESKCKRTYYLSLEFLIGRTLNNAMLNLGVTEEAARGLCELGLILEEISEIEHDAGLGNGGLGRLAACFLDSCATMQLPVMGYGIRYEYGMFRQKIENGEQQEEPDHWLRDGNPWELERPEYTCRVHFDGSCEFYTGDDGRMYTRWVNTKDVLAVPYDIPIPGYHNGTVNTLRLWSSAATDEFDLGEFNAGSYPEAVAEKNEAENITMVLYPNDASENGKALRLKQQYFLVSASLQDVLRHWTQIYGEDFREFADKNCFQMNDTHPAIATAELMRLLMDEYKFEWHVAWDVTRRVMAYTNHTLLPEALEKWPVRMFRKLLPRLLDIIYEINDRFLSDVALRWPDDNERKKRMSIIEEGYDPHIRMAHLAIVSSFSVNGVANLHTKLLTKGLFRDFYELWPEKFNNKTNGVTPRRWLAWANHRLSQLITDKIGSEWITDLTQLSKLSAFVHDKDFCLRWQAIKHQNKQRLAALVKANCDIAFDPSSLFDVQVKRIHEYKRQLLNILHVIHLYDRIKRGDTANWTPRCVLIGGKAAPGYVMAKRIIKLINNVADVINRDSNINNLLKVVFLPDFCVTTMEIIAPGTDISEQISTAGKEASGTGNMKFMMNGALTIGTLDGANIEIREEAGEENFFLFGLMAEEISELQKHYNPSTFIEADEDLSRVMKLLTNKRFNQSEEGIFDDIINSITSPADPWMTAADFRSYVNAQQRVAEAYQDKERWTRMSILTTARSGKFSTDRTIREYNRDIWKMPSAPVQRDDSASA